MGFSQSLVSRDRLDVRVLGRAPTGFGDLYHGLIRLSWGKFFAGFVVAFLLLNLVFAGLFALDPQGLSASASTHFSAFWHAFFFSIHTIATIGYGDSVPISLYANVLVVIETTIGILFFAVTSGIMFARFSQPSARILFSDKMVIRTFQGVPTLMFRAMNDRRNFILEASMNVAVLRTEVVDGKSMRRFHDLPLIRQTNPVFALSWTAMHPIDAASPLAGLDAQSFLAGADEIVVILTGIDASVAQPLHARQAYSPDQVYFDHDFVDVMSVDERGRRVIDRRKFHDVVAISPA
jgi:inward rectifier potassium channel